MMLVWSVKLLRSTPPCQALWFIQRMEVAMNTPYWLATEITQPGGSATKKACSDN